MPLQSESVPDDLSAMFDELYEVVRDRRPVSGDFLKRLNATNRRLLPKLTELQTKVMQSMAQIQRQTGTKPLPMGIEGLPSS